MSDIECSEPISRLIGGSDKSSDRAGSYNPAMMAVNHKVATRSLSLCGNTAFTVTSDPDTQHESLSTKQDKRKRLL